MGAAFISFSWDRTLVVFLALSESTSGFESFRVGVVFSSSWALTLPSFMEAFSFRSLASADGVLVCLAIGGAPWKVPFGGVLEAAGAGLAVEGFCAAFTLASSARCFQILTTGMGASCRGFAGARSTFLPFPFSEVFSLESTDFSTEVDACDLFSQVESEDVFGIEETSSSLVTVEAVEALKSGDETVEAVATCGTAAALEAATGGCARNSREPDVCSERASFASVSSAQLAEAEGGMADGGASFDGVTEPEDGLLGVVEGAGAEERPLAAWA